jgi:hypothetical protein
MQKLLPPYLAVEDDWVLQPKVHDSVQDAVKV